MSHTYEEIRAATFDVLAGRGKRFYGIDQFEHLRIGVGTALSVRAGRGELPPSNYPAETALDAADSTLFLEIFWDLFRDGIITLGSDNANREFPFFRVTARGKALIAGEESYFFHDVTGFEKQLRAKIPAIDGTALLYLKEAFQAFRSGCILSSSVMLGVATEHSFNLLLETIEQNPTYSKAFAAVQKERMILGKIRKFKDAIEQHKANFPRSLLEDFDTQFLGIQSLIRTFRNESGHPSGQIISREQAFVNLQLFVSFGQRVFQLIAHFKNP